jgi:PAS domain S-box-containing protein
MKKENSLKKEILLIFISFSVFITIAIGIISMVNFYYSKLTIIKHNQKQILFQIESEINNFLEQIYTLSFYLKDNYKENSNLLKNIVDTNINISSILVLNKDGIIEDFHAKTNLNIYKGFDYSKQDYFSEIRDGKIDYWSNVFLSSFDEEAAISYSFKSKNKVIVLSIKLKEISNFISRFKNQDGSHMIKVYDESGIIILNPNNPDLVLQRFNQKREKIFTELIDKQKPYTFAIFHSKIFNENQYATYASIDKTQWKVVIRESYDLILKSLRGIIVGVVIIMIVFILLAILLSLQISKRVFNSFDDLQETTTDIANGNYHTQIKKSYYEEFNILLNSFNKMKIEIDKREDSLEASLNSFKSLFNSTMEMIILHDRGICVDVNNVTLEFLGLDDKNKIIGKNLIEFISDDYKSLLKSNYNKNTIPYEFDVIVNNQKFTCLAQDKFIELNMKKLKLSTLIDITELKDKDKLLFQQSKMAAMGEMIGNIAHQWRQPLSIISTCASGIKFEKQLNTIDDNRLFENLDMIVENTQYLSKTIDDFRNFFKADKEIVDFFVKDSIEKVLKLLKSAIQNYNIQINTYYSDEIKINAYANEFLQVIINIINNSKDALQSQSNEDRFIDIKTYAKYTSCYIEISDNGGGIPDDIISKVFDPYFTTKHKSRGTGIGLYMSHQIIVEHMNGSIYIKNIEMEKFSKIYKGCCVTIEIPLNGVYTLDFSI